MYLTDCAIERLTDYRAALETEPPSIEVSFRKTAMDDLFIAIDKGLAEPIDAAYMLYYKYMECMHWAENNNEVSEIFETMADEMSFVVDYLVGCCTY